jgi:hypothetical protein
VQSLALEYHERATVAYEAARVADLSEFRVGALVGCLQSHGFAVEVKGKGKGMGMIFARRE